MPKPPHFILVDPVTLICPRCGAKPGIVCDMLKDQIEIVHIERIKAAGADDEKRRKTHKERHQG